jgi:hypothetical protein
VTTQINVVVTCADRKTTRPQPELTVSTLPMGPVRTRVTEWIRRLEQAPVASIPARDLYTGNHWYGVRDVQTAMLGTGVPPTIWIASAGYGLVPFDSPLKPYAATLSRGRDSVGPASEAAEWWRLLSEWPGPAGGQPRTIANLAKRHPGAVMLIAASAAYLAAMEDDIAVAASALRRDQLAIISAGANGQSSLGDYLLPCDGRGAHFLGVQMQSLNARLLSMALELAPEWIPDSGRLRTLFEQRLGDLPPMRKYDRAPLTDDEVRSYVRQELKSTPKAKHTTLLRRLRDSNQACEQGRFKRLFAEIRAEVTP